MTTVGFDIDGTLLNLDGTPNYEVINLLLLLKRWGCLIFVWTGGGIDYGTRVAEKLGLIGKVSIIRKGSMVPDIAVDDQESATLGKVVLITRGGGNV